jgi:short-chain Z-isoprenyl diphosphate synthase
MIRMTSLADTAFAPMPQQRPVLRHVALVPDGNRRWARERDVPVFEGHRRGGERCIEFLEWCGRHPGIEVVSIGLSSAENLARRPAGEVEGVDRVTAAVIGQAAATGRWRLNLLGDVDLLTPALAETLRAFVASTADVAGPVVNFAVGYSGRAELMRAVDALRSSAASTGPVRAQDIERHLDTAGQPDCDLMIRTAGQTRLCGFMPWQSIYSHLYVADPHWPDFAKSDFARALDSFHGSERRMGS